MGFGAGVLAGFTSQISHAGGPPLQIYALPKRLARDVFIGTSSIFFAVGNWMKVPAYLALGQFTQESLLTSLVPLPLAIVSNWAEVCLVRRVSGERFHTVIYGLLIVVGGKLIWDGWRICFRPGPSAYRCSPRPAARSARPAGSPARR